MVGGQFNLSAQMSSDNRMLFGDPGGEITEHMEDGCTNDRKH